MSLSVNGRPNVDPEYSLTAPTGAPNVLLNRLCHRATDNPKSKREKDATTAALMAEITLSRQWLQLSIKTKYILKLNILINKLFYLLCHCIDISTQPHIIDSHFQFSYVLLGLLETNTLFPCF